MALRTSIAPPSSTIKTVALATAVCTFIVEAAGQFGYPLSATFASSFVALGGTAAGYFVREDVLPKLWEAQRENQE